MQISTDVFVFPVKDPRWKSKAAVGVLIAILGVMFFPLLWLISGYGVSVMRRAIREGDTTTLPDWDDLGGMFIDGLKHSLISLVYTLPFTLIFGCMIAMFMLTFVGAPALMFSDSGGAVEAFAGLGVWLGITVGFAAFGLASLFAIPLVFLSMVALSRSVAHNRLGAAFEFPEVMKLARMGFGNYLLAVVMLYVALLAVNFASSLLIYTVIGCFLYPIVYALLLVYTSVLQGALLGLAYRSTREELKAKSALSAPEPSPASRDVGDMPPLAVSTAISAPTPPQVIDPLLTATSVSAATPPPLPPDATTAPDIAEPPDLADMLHESAAQRDDLTLIGGIGPTFAQRLYDAGITTFAALAARSADDLRAITQARATANPQAWIDEANRRMSP